MTAVIYVEQDYNVLMKLMSIVTGYNESDIRNLRKQDYPMLRAMIAQTLRGLGYTYTQIGTVMDRKYSSVLISIHNLENAIGNPTYREINRIYKQYNEKVSEYRNYLYGTSTEKCIWELPEEKRICVYCTRPHCKERKYTSKRNELIRDLRNK